MGVNTAAKEIARLAREPFDVHDAMPADLNPDHAAHANGKVIDIIKYRTGKKGQKARAYIQNRLLRLGGFDLGAFFKTIQVAPRKWLVVRADAYRKGETHPVGKKERSEGDVIPIVDCIGLDFTPGREFEVHIMDGALLLVQTYSADVKLSDGSTMLVDGIQVTNQAGDTIAEYKFVEFASGAGLMSMGFQEAGAKPTLAFEIDPDISSQYHENVGNHVVLGDFQDFAPGEIKELLREFESPSGRVRFAVAGLPCEPWTASRKNSKQKVEIGENDPRNLFPHFLQVLDQLKLEAFVIENVEGIRSGSHREYLVEHVLTPLKALGYHLTLDEDGLPPVLDAADFGNASDRRRVVIMGSTHGVIPMPVPTHHKDGKFGRLPQVSWGEALGGLLDHEPSDLSDEYVLTKMEQTYWYCATRPDPTGKYKTARWHAGDDLFISGKNYNKNGPQHRPAGRPAFTMMSTDEGRSFFRWKGRLIRMKDRLMAPLMGVTRRLHDMTMEALGNGVPLPLAKALGNVILEHFRLVDAKQLDAQRQTPVADAPVPTKQASLAARKGQLTFLFDVA